MRGLSHREGGKDEHVHRCTCGEWLYVGQSCRTFHNEGGDSYVMEERGTADQPTGG